MRIIKVVSTYTDLITIKKESSVILRKEATRAQFEALKERAKQKAGWSSLGSPKFSVCKNSVEFDQYGKHIEFKFVK